jgi:uncharacterized membrane protein (UPF0182 family)
VEPAFSLTTTFAPKNRQTLAAFMAVNSAPGPNYGTIRVLQLPRNTTVPGPTQVQNNFESEPSIANQLTLLRRGGADIEFGNLLSLPVSGGMLYVEPVYVRAAQGQGFPLLRRVLVTFGDTTVLSNNLGDALAEVFSEGSEGNGSSGNGSGGGGGGGGSQPTEDAQADLVKAIADAQAAYERGVEALAAGDFAAYGRAQAGLEAALNRAAAAQGRITGEEQAPADDAPPEDTPAEDAPAEGAPEEEVPVAQTSGDEQEPGA